MKKVSEYDQEIPHILYSYILLFLGRFQQLNIIKRFVNNMAKMSRVTKSLHNVITTLRRNVVKCKSM